MGHLYCTGMNTSSKKFGNFDWNLNIELKKKNNNMDLNFDVSYFSSIFLFFRKVQEKHHLCHPRYPYPRCSCAVAVRSGKDVFIVDICNSRTIINFASCGDKVLKVIKVNDRNYKVKLVFFWLVMNDWINSFIFIRLTRYLKGKDLSLRKITTAAMAQRASAFTSQAEGLVFESQALQS